MVSRIQNAAVYIIRYCFIALFVLGLSFSLISPVFGEVAQSIFHRVILEIDAGYSHEGMPARWETDGWVGEDYNKIWLRSEGEAVDNQLQDAEFWAMYSRNISTFYDVQLGIRYDPLPESLGYAVIGLNGLAPYWFETSLHLFISHKNNVSSRLQSEIEFLITQRLILEVHLEVNLFAQEVPEKEVGAGLASIEFGLQLRSEFTRRFAPYLEFYREQKMEKTSTIAKRNGKKDYNVGFGIGLRLMF